MIRFFVTMLAVLIFGTNAASSQTRRIEWDAYFVRGSLSGKSALADAIAKNDRTVLKVGADHIVRVFGNEGVPEGNTAATFVAFIRSDRVVEVDCTAFNKPGVTMYRLSTDGKQTDGTWTRGCYAGEKWLAYKDSQGKLVPFVSLSCGNPIHVPAAPPPPARVVDACVEIPVEALRSNSDRKIAQVELRLTLHVWGPKIEGCGLKVVDCYCVDPVTGKAAVGYTTAVITGSGMVRIPRELALRLEAICIVAEGLWPERGVLIRQEMVVRDIRPLAFAGERIVLPKGKGINFYQTGRPHG